jgi:surface polysaccharide O-acyltransferase-like enzyme
LQTARSEFFHKGSYLLTTDIRIAVKNVLSLEQKCIDMERPAFPPCMMINSAKFRGLCLSMSNMRLGSLTDPGRPHQDEVGSRLSSIDLFKFLAFCGVVSIHTVSAVHFTHGGDAFEAGLRDPVGSVVDQLSRFAVPFFFLSSGYLWFGRALRYDMVTFIKSISWLLVVYVFWVAVYALNFMIDGQPLTPSLALKILVNGGYGVQLWFLPCLCSALLLMRVVARTHRWALPLTIGFALYVIGLVYGPYSPLVFGTPSSELTRRICRTLPISAFLFVMIGAWLKSSGRTFSPRTAIVLIAVGAGLTLAEGGVLQEVFRVPMVRNDALLSSIPFGVGVFLLSLHVRLGTRWADWGRALGSMGLGLYLLHMEFVYLIRAYFWPASLVERLAFLLAVIVATTATLLIVDNARGATRLLR